MPYLELVRAEREDFADLLAELTPGEWAAPSLCAGWSVRDVAAHCISFEGIPPRGLAARFLRGRLQTDRINAHAVADLADRSPQQIIAAFRDNAEPHGLTAGFGGRIALTDNMIHQQDIRRPLGRPRRVPPDRLRVALDFVRFAPTIRGAWRTRGVRLVSTDLDWSFGRGPEVCGPAEALLLLMAGRRAAMADVDGPGTPRLGSRL